MEYIKIGETNIPLLGMGTWGMGGYRERDSSNVTQSIGALKKGLDLGFTHIDTGEIYGGGLSEEIVGQAIKNFDRKKVVITSKFWVYEKAEDMVAAVQRSLTRLGIKKLDFCIAHRVPDGSGFAELARGFRLILENGLARNIGVSNVSMAQLKRIFSELGSTTLSAIQVEYNLGNQSVRDELFDFCREKNLLIMAHRPLAQGFLAKSHPVIDELCVKYGKTSAQIALRWLIQQENVVTIPKASSLAHMEENLGALGWKLSSEDVVVLNSLKL